MNEVDLDKLQKCCGFDEGKEQVLTRRDSRLNCGFSWGLSSTHLRRACRSLEVATLRKGFLVSGFNVIVLTCFIAVLGNQM